MYVNDESNHAVRAVTPAGVVSTVAGLGSGAGNFGYVDGPVATAKFNSPDHIAVASGGEIYVGEDQNNAIRKIV